MEKVNEIANNVKENFDKIADPDNLPKMPKMPEMPEFIQNSPTDVRSFSKEFLSSNTLIAKATFLLLIIIIFVFLFFVLSKLIIYFLAPSENPFILNGMKDGTQSMIISQNMGDKSSIPIFRSKNEYDGIEFTYSFWIYVNDVDYPNTDDMKHIFHKGSLTTKDEKGIYRPNNAPGVYLYSGKKNLSDTDLIDKFPLLGLLVRMNIFHDNENNKAPYKFYDDIYVDGIPIKKWVGVIIRLTSQNVVDVYINGTLAKRHKMSNLVKQNYDNLYINMNGGFSGNMSNLQYYNYAIGTFEIDKITSNGPNLKMAENSNIETSKPYYLSSDWYFNNTDPIITS